MTKLFSLMRDCKERSLEISAFDHTSRWCNSCSPVASWRYYQVSKPFVGHGANFFLQFLAAPWWRPFRFHCHPQGKIWVIISFICDNNPKKKKKKKQTIIEHTKISFAPSLSVSQYTSAVVLYWLLDRTMCSTDSWYVTRYHCSALCWSWRVLKSLK